MDATTPTDAPHRPAGRRPARGRRSVAAGLAVGLACSLLLSGCDLLEKKTHAPGPDPTPTQSSR